MIKKIFKAKEVREGAGVVVNRVFGYYEVKDFDPFLMLDYFDAPYSPESPGFPWHPHKGIETISYILKGAGKHQDSLGNSGIIAAGELQWMTAGRGILHQEMPAASPEGSQGFQFWVNMPAKDKLNEPAYEYIKKETMQAYETNGIKVNVIAGTFKDIKGPIDKSNLAITMLHGHLKAGSELLLERKPGLNAFLFVFEGQGKFGSEPIEAVTAYTLDDQDEYIKADSTMAFIYAEGRPLDEPIAWQGPIVMNTKEELIETFRDLEKGTFVK